jgi:catechol 2,3-dioxygenase
MPANSHNTGKDDVMETKPFAATVPVSVAKVGLRSRDAGKLAAYYAKILGLTQIRRSGNAIVLGAGDAELLEIEQSSALREDDPRSAGLFHTAFLFPDRRTLARWTRYAIDSRLPIDGASDHLVSEAFYLTDPDGNGVEIYADRSRDKWGWDGANVKMATHPLGIQNLLAEPGAGDADWAGAPAGTIVGHVHLRVGDPVVAEAWWRDQLEFDTVARYGSQAVFMSTGGYHHHVGANSWRSAGAGPREGDRTGLGFVEFRSARHGEPLQLVDPWGSTIRVVPDD